MTGTATAASSATGTEAARFDLARQPAFESMGTRAVKEHARL